MKTVKKLVFYRSFGGTTHNQKAPLKKGFSLIELVLAIVIVAIALAALPNIVTQTQKSNEFGIKQELTYSAETLMGRIISMPWDSVHIKEQCKKNCSDSECSDLKEMKKKIGKILGNNPNSCLDESKLITPIYLNNINNNNLSNRKGTAELFLKNGNDKILYDLSYRLQEFNSSKMNEFDKNSFGVNIGRNDIDDFGYGKNRSGKFTDSVHDNAGDFLSSINYDTNVVYFDDFNLKYNANDVVKIKFDREKDKKNSITNVKIVEVIVDDAETREKPKNIIKLFYYSANIGEYVYSKLDWKGKK